MITIKVLGSGCPNCEQVEAHAREAVEHLRPTEQVEIVKVTDPLAISEHVLSTPGLMINERVVAEGRIPQSSEIVSWLAEAMS